MAALVGKFEKQDEKFSCYDDIFYITTFSTAASMSGRPKEELQLLTDALIITIYTVSTSQCVLLCNLQSGLFSAQVANNSTYIIMFLKMNE